MRQIHILQHVPFEGPGSIYDWLKKSSFKVSKTCFWNNDYELPSPREVDGLVILGGPMGVYDDFDYDWLSSEKDFIREYIATGKPVLGICLGAQLLADALGSLILPNSHKEIGFFPVFDTANKVDSLLSHIPDSIEVLHWHGDTFDIPVGAINLLESKACKNQAFQYGSNILGLQFHLEATPDNVDQFILHSRNELAAGGLYVQTEHELLQKTKLLAGLNRSMHRILEQLFVAKS